MKENGLDIFLIVVMILLAMAGMAEASERHTINFDELVVGETLSDQYMVSHGVTFSVPPSEGDHPEHMLVVFDPKDPPAKDPDLGVVHDGKGVFGGHEKGLESKDLGSGDCGKGAKINITFDPPVCRVEVHAADVDDGETFGVDAFRNKRRLVHSEWKWGEGNKTTQHITARGCRISRAVVTFSGSAGLLEVSYER